MASDHACGSRASDMGHRKQQMPNGHLSIRTPPINGCHKVIRRLHCTTLHRQMDEGLDCLPARSLDGFSYPCLFRMSAVLDSTSGDLPL